MVDSLDILSCWSSEKLKVTFFLGAFCGVSFVRKMDLVSTTEVVRESMLLEVEGLGVVVSISGVATSASSVSLLALVVSDESNISDLGGASGTDLTGEVG